MAALALVSSGCSNECADTLTCPSSSTNGNGGTTSVGGNENGGNGGSGGADEDELRILTVSPAPDSTDVTTATSVVVTFNRQLSSDTVNGSTLTVVAVDDTDDLIEALAKALDEVG